MKIVYLARNTCLFIAFFIIFPINFPFVWLSRKNHRVFRVSSYGIRFWMHLPIIFSGFYPKKNRSKNIKGAAIYVANHSSRMDIPLLYSKVDRPINFIGKKELAKIPLLGLAYAAVNILLDRSSRKSIRESLEKSEEKIKQGISIVIFPEGGVPKDHNIKLAPFKNGAFSLAIHNQIPIIPVTMPDNKKCFPYKPDRPLGRLFGSLRIIFHDPIETKGMSIEKDLKVLKDRVWNIIERSLDS